MSKDVPSVADVASEMARIPERLDDARKALDGWRGDIEKMVKKNPVQTVLGAFVVGYVFAKVSRYL